MENKGSILLIDDEVDVLKVLIRRLTDVGYTVLAYQNSLEGLARAKDIQPDLIILDIMMPIFDGVMLKQKLNDDVNLSEIPVLFLTAKQTTPDKVKGLNMGAVDYVTKPFQIDELLARIDAAIKRRRHYEKIAVTDSLTGLGNRRVFERQLDVFFNMAKRYGETFTLILIDLDNLKKINDKHGHQAGDKALSAVGEAMKIVFRKSDMSARYGGDEFLVLLPQTDRHAAELAVVRLKKELNKARILAEGEGTAIPVSVSVGVAEYNQKINQPRELFELADKRLYEAKAGRSDVKRKKRSILLVEDEPDISKAIAFRLEKAGYEVNRATDGEKGLSEAVRLRPDLIVLDLMLPKLSGEEVCKALREGDDAALAKTPILMLTAKTSMVDQIVGRSIGANCYMCKPFEPGVLLENIHKLAGT